jgi:hypothetical protein
MNLQLAQEDRLNYQRQFDELVEQQNRINEEQESLNQQIKGVDQALGLIQKRIRDAEVCTLSACFSCILTSLRMMKPWRNVAGTKNSPTRTTGLTKSWNTRPSSPERRLQSWKWRQLSRFVHLICDEMASVVF